MGEKDIEFHCDTAYVRYSVVIDMVVEIVDYDPAWPRAFDEQRALLAQTLGTWLNGTIEHVGRPPCQV